MTEVRDNSALRALVDGVVRLAATEVFTWASGETEAPTHAFKERLRHTILEKLEGHAAVEALTITIDDTRLGYYSGGCYTRVRVALSEAILFEERLLLDEAARKLQRLIRERPRHRFGKGDER